MQVQEAGLGSFGQEIPVSWYLAHGQAPGEYPLDPRDSSSRPEGTTLGWSKDLTEALQQ